MNRNLISAEQCVLAKREIDSVISFPSVASAEKQVQLDA